MTRLRPSYPACAPADRPLLYDLAYNVFDVASECDHLISLANLHGLSRICQCWILVAEQATMRCISHRAAPRSRLSMPTGICCGMQESSRGHDGATQRRSSHQRRYAQGAHGPARKPGHIRLGASFNSLLSDDEALGTLDVVGRSLRSGGVFLLDLHDPKGNLRRRSGCALDGRDNDGARPGNVKMVPKGADRYRWDIAVKATFADGRRQSTIMRTSARPWTKRQLQRLCRTAASLILPAGIGWKTRGKRQGSSRHLPALDRQSDRVLPERT